MIERKIPCAKCGVPWLALPERLCIDDWVCPPCLDQRGPESAQAFEADSPYTLYERTGGYDGETHPSDQHRGGIACLPVTEVHGTTEAVAHATREVTDWVPDEEQVLQAYEQVSQFPGT